MLETVLAIDYPIVVVEEEVGDAMLFRVFRLDRVLRSCLGVMVGC